jgi:hypothetical protein
MNAQMRAAIGGSLAAVLIGGAAAACGGGTRTAADRAAVERAAINRDLKKDADALSRIAVTRTKVARPDVREQPITCAASNVDIEFVGEQKAIYTATYACGVAPWKPGQAPPLATPTIKVEVLKESSTWKIDAFL